MPKLKIFDNHFGGENSSLKQMSMAVGVASPFFVPGNAYAAPSNFPSGVSSSFGSSSFLGNATRSLVSLIPINRGNRSSNLKMDIGNNNDNIGGTYHDVFNTMVEKGSNLNSTIASSTSGWA